MGWEEGDRHARLLLPVSVGKQPALLSPWERRGERRGERKGERRGRGPHVTCPAPKTEVKPQRSRCGVVAAETRGRQS